MRSTTAQITTLSLNGKNVSVHLTAAAVRELDLRTSPLVVELELYFSCLVKKAVRFPEQPCGGGAMATADKLHVYFRPVVSTACTIDEAQRLGRQPETEIDSPALRRIAPRQVFLDHAAGQWRGSYVI